MASPLTTPNATISQVHSRRVRQRTAPLFAHANINAGAFTHMNATVTLFASESSPVVYRESEESRIETRHKAGAPKA